MLIHALLDNKLALGDGLTYQLYNGYFNGTDASPNISWFDTAELITSGVTSNLSSLTTATNNQFQDNLTDTEAMNDNWDMSGYTYTPSNMTINTRTANNMRITTNGFDPQLALGGASRPTVNSTNFKYIHIRCKIVSFQPGTVVDELQLFYFNSTGQGIDGSRRLVYPYGNFILGQWINIVFDMTNITNWTVANWNQYRLDPIRDGNCVIDYDYFIITNSPVPPDFDNKSLKISGAFRAKKTGVYRFFTRSDDASFLYIDGVQVIANGGIRAAQNRFGNFSMTVGSYYQFIIYYGEYSFGAEFSAGYLEPNADGTTSGSSNLNDFIKDGTNLGVFYQNNYSSGGGNTTSTLIYRNASLYGRYKISLIGLYVDRSNFTTGKDDLLFISSPQLYVPGNGSRLLVLHEEPVSSDFVRKDYHSFSDEFELVSELNGIIELKFVRTASDAEYERALLVMQADKI